MRFVMALVVSVALADAHTYHSSIAQLDYIAAKKTIEVIVWLHTEDMERAFKAKHGVNANFDRDAEAFVSEYLRTTFELRNREGKRLEQKWVGLELKVHFLAAYFEVPAGALTGLTLTNRLLIDGVPDQVNSVQVKQDGQARNDLQFDRAHAGTQALLKPQA